ncbi:MAG: hydantoinase/oxoprolinase family protein [Halobacteriales archaeon]|nr:hydantoinase/oxoprolinase family protein [Halobacteriales archaeon]
MRIGVDVGGTFTDVTLSAEDCLRTAKTPTTDDQSVGVAHGVEKVCEEAGVEPSDADGLVHATTVGVNALLEREGAETALVTTEGFGDVLEIRRQTRDELYDLEARRAPPFVPRERRYEVSERATVEGVEEEVAEEELRSVPLEDAESVAVCFLHSYAHPENEREAERVLRDEFDAHISVSSDVLPEFREYERASTTVVDAYVTPRVASYLNRLVERLDGIGAPEPHVMSSNGGVVSVERATESAVGTVMSGPAGGVVGAAEYGDRVVSFDMGGTSTDVGLVRDGIEKTTETRVEGAHVGVPSVDVTTVGAGGGSVARIDEGGALRVGPESAGAEPGPACYGRGGERPTVTDADVALGYIRDGKEFGDEVVVDAGEARYALGTLEGFDDVTEAALGIRRVADERTARAVRSMTVERGYDPRSFTLVAFGGAGPAHAAKVAESLGVEEVVVPRAGGVLSAYGLLRADEKAEASRTVGHEEDHEDVLSELEDEAREELGKEDALVRRYADVRYAGQGTELTVSVGRPFDAAEAHDAFEREHETRYGYTMDEETRVVALRAEAVVENDAPKTGSVEREREVAVEKREAVFEDGTRETAFYDGIPDGTLETPSVVEYGETTAVVPPGWEARVKEGDLYMSEEDRR